MTTLARRQSMLDRYGLRLIVAGFLLLTVWTSLVIPPFETPDELYHYAFARHLAQGNPLPVQSATSSGPWEQEGSQAPLYYWLVGRLTAGIDQSDFDALAVTNPRANIGDPLFPGNKNRMLYSSVAYPLTGTNLALHVARWFSALLGALSVWSVGRTAALAFAPGDRRALLPPLLLACIPQFVFISASCSNDNLVIALSSVTVYWLARLLTIGDARSIRVWEWTVLGGLLAVAALSKLQGLGLFIPAAGVGVVIVLRRRDWWLPLRAIGPVALPPLLIAGWWYWRNWTLYGDWTGLDHLASINGLRAEPLTWDGWWLEFRGLRYSFWGLFGWFNILLPQWVYTLLDGLSVVALGGILAAPWLGQRPPRAMQWVRGLLALWVLLTAALLLYWVLRAMGSQGRLFFPAIGATIILLVVGLGVWFERLPRALRRVGYGAPVALLLGATIYAAAWLLPRSYAAPTPLAQLPADARPVDITYRGHSGDQLTLAAITAPSDRYQAGQAVPVTLYLTTAAHLSDDYEVFVQLLDATGAVYGNTTTHPGWGRNPTTRWQPGALYADPYTVQVNRRIDARSPVLARIYTGFVNPSAPDDARTPLDARNVAGEPILPAPAEVVLLPWSQPQAEEYGLDDVSAQFGDAVALRAAHVAPTVSAGATLTVTLLWEATAHLDRDLSAFVHLVDTDGIWQAGYDQAPGGILFPTRVWQRGDRVVADMPLLVPDTAQAGDYTVWVGLYPSADPNADRLAAQASLLPVQHNAVQLGTIRITP